MTVHGTYYLELSFAKMEILRQCVAIAITDGSIFGGCDPDVRSVARRCRLVYELAVMLDDLTPRPGPKWRSS